MSFETLWSVVKCSNYFITICMTGNTWPHRQAIGMDIKKVWGLIPTGEHVIRFQFPISCWLCPPSSQRYPMDWTDRVCRCLATFCVTMYAIYYSIMQPCASENNDQLKTDLKYQTMNAKPVPLIFFCFGG